MMSSGPWRRLGMLLILTLGGSVRVARSQQSAATCFGHDRTGGIEQLPLSGPCGDAAQQAAGYTHCCDSGDTCMQDGICKASTPIASGSSASGYYIGGCTDASMATNMCNYACASLPNSDIVWNGQQWQCCGSDLLGRVSCDNATSTSFSAPDPSDLASSNTYVVPSIAAAMPTLYTGSSMGPTSVPASNNNGTQGTAAATGLSSGAKAGIGVGVAAGAIVAILIVLYLLLLRRMAHLDKMYARSDAASNSSWLGGGGYSARTRLMKGTSRSMSRIGSVSPGSGRGAPRDSTASPAESMMHVPRYIRSESGVWRTALGVAAPLGSASSPSPSPSLPSYRAAAGGGAGTPTLENLKGLIQDDVIEEEDEPPEEEKKPVSRSKQAAAAAATTTTTRTASPTKKTPATDVTAVKTRPEPAIKKHEETGLEALLDFKIEPRPPKRGAGGGGSGDGEDELDDELDASEMP